MAFSSDSYQGLPGFSATVESFANVFTWGKPENVIMAAAQISGAARDTGNTSFTGEMRAGLILGRITATPQLLKQYDPAATDGSQVAIGILATGVRALDVYGQNTARFTWMVVAGPIKAASLYGLDANARGQMRGRFLFDDDLSGTQQNYGSWFVEVPKTTNYTVVAADTGTLFTTLGAVGSVAFTLPTLAPGLNFTFLNLADQTMSVVSAEGDNIVTANDLQADSVGFATGGDKIGGMVRVTSNQAGTAWYVAKLSSNAMLIAS